jgi:formate dehydrogenase major subunit
MLRRALRVLSHWPAARQVAESGLGDAAVSDRTRQLHSRLHDTRAVPSVCPYCAVGCGTLVHVRGDDEIVSIEGNPESPINQGTLCPKGADTFQYTVNPNRLTHALYRRPYGARWERVSLGWAMERIARLARDTRDRTYRERDDRGRVIRQTPGIGFLGGAALDNEENYLIKKLCIGLGVIFVENQARI